MGLVWNSTYTYKNTNFLLYKQVKLVEFSLKKREKPQVPCKAYVIPLQVPFSSHSFIICQKTLLCLVVLLFMHTTLVVCAKI